MKEFVSNPKFSYLLKQNASRRAKRRPSSSASLASSASNSPSVNLSA